MRICILGLGNPGARYEGTRHNIGFDWIDACVSHFQVAPWSERFEALWCEGKCGDLAIHFLKPLTFMNLSGRALNAWLQKYQGDSRVLVAYDDMDLPLGRLRLRGEGSDGGHRGLRSLLNDCAHRPLFRLRIGVGRPSIEAVEHVLGSFNPAEKLIVKNICSDAGEHLKTWMNHPLELAMTKLNGLDYTHGT